MEFPCAQMMFENCLFRPTNSCVYPCLLAGQHKDTKVSSGFRQSLTGQGYRDVLSMMSLFQLILSFSKFYAPHLEKTVCSPFQSVTV